MNSVKGIGKERIFNTAFLEKGRNDVVKWDIMPIGNGEKLKISFESVSSPWRQGVWLKTDKGILVNAKQCPSVELWQDNAPSEIFFECFSSDGKLSVYNVWDKGNGRESQAWTSGMLIEDLSQGRRYRCNDIGFDTKFDKIIFSVLRCS